MKVTINVSDTTLQTERLTLRPWKQSDLPDFYEYAKVEGVGVMAGWPAHKSLEESQQILNRFIENANDFAVVYKEHGKAIGSLGIHQSWADDMDEYKHLKVVEIGYVLAKDYWGRGLMPEAVKAALGYCFDTLGVDAVSCAHFTHNMQSKRVIEKSGFTFVMEGKHEAKLLDKVFDSHRYLITKEEYLKLNK